MRNITFSTLSLALILTACNPAPPALDTPVPTALPLGLTAEGGDWEWLFDAPPDPINLEVEPETSRSVEAVITPDGGKLEATGADGTHYVLDLPAGSVVMDTLVRMTPVETISGLPLEQTTTGWGVQLEPDGLQILADATLTIQFSTPPPILEQIPFQYQGDGQGFSLALPVVNMAVDTGVDNDGIQLAVPHFSGYGVAKGFLAELDPIRQRLGGTVEQVVYSVFALFMQLQRQHLLTGQDFQDVINYLSNQLIKEFVGRVLQPRIDAGQTDCAAGRLAVDTLVGVQNLLRLMADAGFVITVALPQLPEGYVKNVLMLCLQEEYEMCRDQHVIHRMIPVLSTVRSRMSSLGIDDPLLDPEVIALVEKCMTFELQFDSILTDTASTAGVGIGSRASTTVTSIVAIELNLDSIYRPYLFGDGDVIVSAYDFAQLPFDRQCYVSGAESTDGQITIPRLGFIPGGWENGDYPRYVGVDMLYYLTGIEQRRTYQCVFYVGGTSTTDWHPLYRWAFEEVHREEYDPGVGFRAMDWAMGPGELLFGKTWGFTGDLVARKTWELRGSGDSGEHKYEETGSFTLLHRPG